MEEIKCPKCGEVFVVDGSGYSAILKQVRDKEFDKEIKEYEKRFENDKNLALTQLAADKDKELAQKNDQIAELRAEINKEYSGVLSEKENKITELQGHIANSENAKELALSQLAASKDKEIEQIRAELTKVRVEINDKYKGALAEKENKITELQGHIVNSENAKELALSQLAASKDKEIEQIRAELTKVRVEINDKYKGALAEKENKITELQGKIENSENEKKLALTQLSADKDRCIIQKDSENQRLLDMIEEIKKSKEIEVDKIKGDHEIELRRKDDEIAYYRDLKARSSTKMIGESLERHCEDEFNRFRATGFQRAYFEKDNDARTGSKGDYIFRDKDENGFEFISIMFEMKNQADTTATKKKNEDFFKELDKDRQEKKCEYAVLVSMLEEDSEFYNVGIVDVSYKYPKMYVIRPQFFIPMITLLRNAALNSLEYQRELTLAKEQNNDIENFENNLNEFKRQFGRNYRIASDKFKKAVDDIDKAINQLKKIKDELLSSDRQLELANNKAEDLTIKKLTRNNPTMAEKFAQIRAAKEEADGDDGDGGDDGGGEHSEPLGGQTRFEFK